MHGLACIVVVPIDRKCDRLRRINPSAPYDKSESLGSEGGGDGRKAGKLKGIDGKGTTRSGACGLI